MSKETHEELWDIALERLHGYRILGVGVEQALEEVLTMYCRADTAVASPHPTEEKYPEQTLGFKEILTKMYQTHLDKNQDYSPANILGTGEIGLATRLWDKVVRYVSLMGFRIEAKLVAYEAPKEPKNESVNDTLLDIAVYGIIGLLLRKGVWGK